MTTRRRSGAIAFWLPVIALWMVPLVVLAVLVPLVSQREDESLQRGFAASVTVGLREWDLRQDVEVVFELVQPEPAHLASSGLITAVYPLDPAAIVQGSALARIDGVDVAVHVGPAPLYRPVGPDTKGWDVGEVSEFLSAVGLSNTLGRDQSYSASLGRAVRDYQARVGAPIDGVFTPELVVWVARDAVVATGELLVGDRVEVGDPALTMMPTASGMTVRVPGGDQVKVAMHAGPYRLARGEIGVELSALPVDAATAEAVYSQLDRFAVTDASDDGLATVSGVTIALATPTATGTVPVSAIYTSPDGVSCLFEAGEESVPIHLDVITSVPGELSSSGVEAALAGTEVVRDPLELPATTLELCG